MTQMHSMATLERITRYREQALDSAGLLAALATSRVEASSRLAELGARQDPLLHDLLHEFAFRARRYFELTQFEGIDIRTELEQASILGTSPDEGHDESDDWYSLWFVLNRIIHSAALRIDRATTLDGPPDVVYQDRPWGFYVRSDRDAPGKEHFIFVEFLLERFVQIDEKCQDMLR
jgi:hypothetical protein